MPLSDVCSILCTTIILYVHHFLPTPAGGSLSNSLAIMTDAAHMLSDFASFLISLFAIWIASRSPTKMMSFGWHRAGMYVCGVPHKWKVEWEYSMTDWHLTVV